MKHFFIVFLIEIFFSFNISAQEPPINLPLGIDINTVKPSDIPSSSQLKQAGLSDSQIDQLMKIKNQNGTTNSNNSDFQQQKANEQKKAIDTSGTTKSSVEKADSISKINLDTLPEKIFGHSFFKNSNIKFYDKANQLKAPDNYILGVGDQLNISIWGYSDFNDVFTIDETGAINPKLVGRIYLSGLTFKEVKGLIASKFKTVYDLTNSQMDITLTYSRIITVNIVGEVKKPGAYTIPAINTAFNALVGVGGIKSIGTVRNIYVKRGGSIVKKLDVYEYLMNPDSKQDFFLENNDYIFVPPAGRVVNITGQVKRPSEYELIDNENLDALIKYAAGFEAGAYRKRIQLKRFLDDAETIIDINYDSLTLAKKDFELLDGDSVIVRKVPVGYSNYVGLDGPVKLPGNYELKQGERISDFIKKAGGVTYDVFDSRAYVIRLNTDLSKKYIPFNLKEILQNNNSTENIKLQNLDIIKIFSKTYFKDDFIFSVLGTVRAPGNFMYGDGVTLKDALYIAGGLKKEAAKNRIEISRAVDFSSNSGNLVPIRTIVKTIQVGDDLQIDKNSEEFIIQPYDQVLVRTAPDFNLQKNIILNGEVMYPGAYPILSNKEKITNIIQRAGGLNQWAFPEGAKLYRNEFKTGFVFFKLKDVMKDTNSKYNYVLKGGDSLFIPKIQQLIQIRGAIRYPNIDSLKQISSPYTHGRNARYYVKNYGLGFVKKADRKRTYVMESGGFIHRTKHFLFIKKYPKVPIGAVIVVPLKIVDEAKNKKQSEPVDWNRQIENFTVKLTGIATLYLLISKLAP